MSSSDQPQSDFSLLDEELVAYLDGELDEAAARRVEERLSSDEQARSRLNQLAASWDLLDQLPKATVDENFTRTTVSMVALKASEDLQATKAQLPVVRRRRWVAGVAAALAAAMVGFAGVLFALPDPNEPLLTNLPLVRDFDQYLDLGMGDAAAEIAFLRRLHEEELFTSKATETAPSDSGTPIPEERSARREWIEALAAGERNELRRQFERYLEKPEAERQRLESLANALAEAEDAATLRRVLKRYHEWLAMLSPLDRGELVKLEPESRLSRIGELKQHETSQLVRRVGAGKLTPEDIGAIFEWLHQRALDDEQHIRARARERDLERLDELGERERVRHLLFLTLGHGGGFQLPSAQIEKNWNELRSKLSASVQDELKGTPEQQRKTLDDMLRQAMAARQWHVSWEDLKRFFEERLTEDERKELGKLPREEFQKQLRRKYFEMNRGPRRGDFPGFKPDHGPGRGEHGKRGDRGGRDDDDRYGDRRDGKHRGEGGRDDR